MTVKQQLIQDIEQLPEHTLQAISVIVKEFTLWYQTNTSAKPVFGSGKGQMWISDDFDAPLEELKEYME